MLFFEYLYKFETEFEKREGWSGKNSEAENLVLITLMLFRVYYYQRKGEATILFFVWKRQLYTSTYCTPIIGCATNSNIQLIHKVQKKAIRIITRKAYTAHTDPIFKELEILPFPKLISFAQLKLMHSILFSYCPSSLRQIFLRNEQRDLTQNLRNADEYVVPYPRIELFRKSLLFWLPTEWNLLPDLKLQHNRITFEINLKEHLLSTIISE